MSLFRIGYFRHFSINKFHLIQTSFNIQKIIQSKNIEALKCFELELNQIHQEYRINSLATSTKKIYDQNSSKFNSKFLQFESNRNEQIHLFDPNSSERLIILLKYIRFIQISSIYRFITLDIQQISENISETIFTLTKNEKSFEENRLCLICELCFFIKYFLNEKTLSQTKDLISKTFIEKYLFDFLLEENTFLLIEEISSTLYSINSFPSDTNIHHLSIQLLNSLFKHRSTSEKILLYLQFIQHQSKDEFSKEMFILLNDYLVQIGIHQNDFNVLCLLLVFISSCNYSHQVFIENILKKIQKKSLDEKLSCRLIYYLCLLDPTNRFHSRSTLVQLTRQIAENINEKKIHSQWIIQSQYGLMMRNIYHYQLLFQILQRNYFPTLFRKKIHLGVSTSFFFFKEI